MSLIEIEHVHFSYENEKVLRDITLHIEEGSFVAILGHNGSGKSTLAKLLNLILQPTSGSIRIAGKCITDPAITEEDLIEIRKEIGMVFQNPDNQLVSTVVEEDIAFGPENLGLPSEEIRRRVDEALKMVGMSAYAKHSPHQLSGGQKQRIAIAGILAMLPRCIIFDESTAMLDPSGRQEVMKTISMLHREKHMTILHITHNMEEAVLADRVVVLNDGAIYMDGSPREVFSRVKALTQVGLDVPQAAELIHTLRARGVKLPEDIISEEEAADALAACWKL